MSMHDPENRTGRPCHNAPLGLALATLLAASTTVSGGPPGPGLGKPLSAAEIADVDLNVFPDGSGLPAGQGTVAEGRVIYETRCAACHGAGGSGGSAGELMGRSPLAGSHPDQTIGNYWPYATTIFDFVRRSMPLNAPRSLTDSQVYAVTAWLLHINGLLDESATLDARTLPAIRMPNRDGFIPLWPETRER